MMLPFAAFAFWEYHARKGSFDLEREGGWVVLPNLLVFIIFIQCVCSTWGILDKTFIVGRGNKEFTKAVDVCKCGPLNAPTLRLYWSPCKNQSIQRKKWILTSRNNKRLHVFHIQLAITKEEYLLMRAWGHGCWVFKLGQISSGANRECISKS